MVQQPDLQVPISAESRVVRRRNRRHRRNRRWRNGGGGIGGTTGSVNQNGGTLSRLGFAVVGDTRPATPDDTAGYPTQIITQIWQDVQAETPRIPFAVTTGDYMFASTSGTTGAAQLNIYLAARKNYTNVVFPIMGNHECTGATASNCGSGNKDGITNNYTDFMQMLLGPIGKTKPYYEIDINAADKSWTAKFLFVAANAWTSAQATWLNTAMSKSTTYTFVVRHEGSTATTAPGVTPSANIMAKHPYTLLIAGHTHTFAYYSSERQIINGNGGAPLTASMDYGYLVAWQRNDGAIQFTEKDYATKAVVKTFAVKANGTPTP